MTYWHSKDSFTRIEFAKDAAGQVTGMKIIGRIGPVQTLKRTDKPLPEKKKEIAIDPSVLDQYIGEYELAPSMTISIFKEGTKLMSQMAGQEKVEILPESETKFFLKVIDAEIEFVKDESGKVTGFVLYRTGQKMPAKKIK